VRRSEGTAQAAIEIFVCRKVAERDRRVSHVKFCNNVKAAELIIEVVNLMYTFC
jgi:hypothetical protein